MRLMRVLMADGSAVDVRAETPEAAREKARLLTGQAAVSAEAAPCRHPLVVFREAGAPGECARCGAAVPAGYQPGSAIRPVGGRR